MYSVHNNHFFKWLGSPIRKFPDQRLLGTSPRLIAPCYVLHRPIMSRHSPCALLHTTKTQNCASFFVTYNLLDSLTYSIVKTCQIQPHSSFGYFRLNCEGKFLFKKTAQSGSSINGSLLGSYRMYCTWIYIIFVFLSTISEVQEKLRDMCIENQL